MENIETLTQLLQTGSCHYTIFDLGRRVTQIDNQLFYHVELGQQPYPYPLKREAQLAIVYWDENASDQVNNKTNGQAKVEPWVWFLKFPLDERGLFRQADIGQFIQYVIEAIGTRLGVELVQEEQDKLANNPYTFKPNEEKMAVFHSQLRASLGLSCSQYYSHAQDYFSGKLGWNNWQGVGLQGITDICARLSEDQNNVLVRKALRKLPPQVLYVLLGALEHTDISEKLANSLSDLTQQLCSQTEPDLFLLSAHVRALAGTKPEILNSNIASILSNQALNHPEVLIAIAGRSWLALQDIKLAELFLIRLAQTGDQVLFNQLFADLVMLPALRPILLPMLNSTASKELTEAIMQLQLNTKAATSSSSGSSNSHRVH